MGVAVVLRDWARFRLSFTIIIFLHRSTLSSTGVLVGLDGILNPRGWLHSMLAKYQALYRYHLTLTSSVSGIMSLQF